MSGTGKYNSVVEDDDFAYTLVIVVIVAHLLIMAIIIYYSCCRKKCVCSINIQNNTIHQRSSSEETRMSAGIAPSDSDGEVGINERPVSNRSTSMISEDRFRANSFTDTSGYPGEQTHGPPPQYSEHVVYTNAGATFEDIDLHLPSYDDIAGQLPSWSDVQETGQYVSEKPPTYEEAAEAKRRER